jgi:D-arginine dehydrogenase
MESTLAFHTTGRSAAVFVESLGTGEIRTLTLASKDFLLAPPACFESAPLSPRPLLRIAAQGRGEVLREHYAQVRAQLPDARLVDVQESLAINPVLSPAYVELGLYEPGAMEMDVHAIHQGFVRGLRERGGQVHTSAKVVRATRRDGIWSMTTADGGEFGAPVVVNAAGAWVDLVAATFGARPVGIRPMRRSIFMVSAPAGLDTTGLPLTADVDSTFYFKPEGDQFLCSPSEENPHPPGDVRADELEVARAIEAINQATTLQVRSVRTQWAGLRSFVADHNPAAGFDGEAEGFFWFAGQGGTGIQTAPALARTAAALPADMSARGLDIQALEPTRLALGGRAGSG